jgi:hypothetical protein
MIITWDSLVECFGPEIDTHRPKFAVSEETTFGLLLSRYGSTKLRYSYKKTHAEPNLLASDVWRKDIPEALRHWTELDGDNAIVVVMVLSRSPCSTCSELLVQELNELNKVNDLAFDRNSFVLACRGAYNPNPKGGPDASVPVSYVSTSNHDLIRLRDVGWGLCVLQVGKQLAPSGEELLLGLKNIQGVKLIRPIGRRMSV